MSLIGIDHNCPVSPMNCLSRKARNSFQIGQIYIYFYGLRTFRSQLLVMSWGAFFTTAQQITFGNILNSYYTQSKGR